MARTDERFKLAYNALLDRCAALGPEQLLPSELALSADLSVSRTVIRAALAKLNDNGFILWDGRTKTVLKTPGKADRFEIASPPPTQEQLEARFFEWLLRFDVPAGTPLNAAQLARDLEVPPHALQEFLGSLSRFGLVQRRARGGWELVGFTGSFAVELSDFRTVLELNAVSQLIAQPDDHPIWTKLQDLKQRHLTLQQNLVTNFHDFSQLDEAFHVALNGVVNNRFVGEFQRVISMIFHYHYQWEKDTELARNADAINEHLALIQALKDRDEPAALAAAKAHMSTAKKTLLQSMRSHHFT